MPNRMNIWIRKAFDRLKEKFGGCCILCGSKEHLHFAHTAPTSLNGSGRGRKERYYDIKKNPDNYVLLCRGCHLEFDRNVRFGGDEK